MKFKDESLRNDFWKIDPRCKMVICDLDYFCILKFNKEITITNFMIKEGTSDTHPEGRAVDIRSFDFTENQVQLIKNYLLEKYQYLWAEVNKIAGKIYFIVVYHDIGKGLHFHIQVPRPFLKTK